MNEYYDNAYQMRLNRYGNDYQSRILGQRIKVFQNLLLKSIYRVDFEYEGQQWPGILERYKQNETKTLQYLLTELELKLPGGTILNIPDEEGNERWWMVYWLENIETSGYNRYVMLKMSHVIHWKDRNGDFRTIRAYFYGQEDNMLKDELKSRSRNRALYTENLKLSFFITPFNAHIRKDDYFEVITGPKTGCNKEEETLKESFVVTGYDTISTEGVEYVSVDPQYIRDLTPAPQRTEEDDPSEFYWLEGGELHE